MADEGSIDLLKGNFLRGQLAGLEQQMLLQVFSKHISVVRGMLNDGKEATVYGCRGHHGEFFAAKVYRDRRFRAFGNESAYMNVDAVTDRRMAKAIRKRSKVGRRASQRMWVAREWEALNVLHDSNASVPQPYDHAPDAILMELVGEQGVAAPMLAQTRMTRTEAERAWRAVLEDVEILLACEIVHGDLSAYNILYHEHRPRLIDLPQVIDLDAPGDHFPLFHRDIENVAGHFQRQGLTIDPLSVAIDLWQRYV